MTVTDRSPQQITQRLDKLIEEIRERFHAKTMSGNFDAKNAPPSDVLVVAHGHILRAFAARWIAKNIADNPSLLLEAGGVGTLRYVQSLIQSRPCRDRLTDYIVMNITV